MRSWASPTGRRVRDGYRKQKGPAVSRGALMLEVLGGTLISSLQMKTLAESLHDSVLTGTPPEEWEPVVAVSAASSESGVDWRGERLYSTQAQ